ncbi:MAG: PAS domain S-box protein [Nitrospirae bacterium]|nr:PAS domain S-box protein [Nitrospirota bacterium]
MGKAKILIVEDEAIIAKDLQWRLEGMGYDAPLIVATGQEAINTAHETAPDLILMDIMLLGPMDGIEAANRIREKADIPVIYLTAYADEEVLERAKITEPFGYLIKPIGDRELHGNIEITLHKHRVDKKLRENEKWLYTVLTSIGDAVITTDTNGHIIFMNPAAEELTGWKKEEVAGNTLENIFNIINENTGEKVENPVQKVLRQGSVVGLANNTVLITRNGTRVPIDDSGAPIKDEKGNILGVVMVFSDITARKKAEALLLQSKKDWEDTFNTITDMITIHDKDFNIIRANKAAEKILGLPLMETSRVACYKYYHGTANPPESCPSCQCLKTGEPSTFELYEPHLNMFLELRAMPRFDRDNKLIGLIHVARDISERKKIEEEIKKAKVEWEMTFDSANEFIILVDKELNIARCNRSFAKFAKKTVDEIIGRKCSLFFPCDAARDDDAKPASNIEIKTDSGHWLYLSSYSILDERGEFLHTIIMATDITDMKNTQQRLLKSEDELRTRIKELEDFYEMAVGRELKMKELKNEIGKLKKTLAKEKETKEKLISE